MNQTTNDQTCAQQEVRASINERMFFKTMQHLFSSSFSVMGELIQNARRAGAKRIDITLDSDKRTICVIDDGIGIESFEALLELAASGWSSEEVQLSDKPFGMGFFSVFYACKHVVVYSRRRCLQASRNDIIERRAIGIFEDDTHQNLTRIELHGVVDQLLRVDDRRSESPAQTFERELKTLVAGFPVPVFLNGIELPRPVARNGLEGEITPVGFVSIAGIHRTGTVPTATPWLVRNLWLQGLPIEASAYSYRSDDGPRLPDVVVHLDSASFQARMPDRSHLYDSATQRARVDEAVKAVILNHIVLQKANLNPADFTRQYWSLTAAYGMAHIFNDVPYLPTAALELCSNAVRSTEYQDAMCRFDAIDAPLPEGDLVKRQDILDGRIKIWRNAPSCVSDDPWAALALKTMQRENILRLEPSGITSDHWINEITPCYHDLVFRVEVEADSDRSVNFTWSDSSTGIRIAKKACVHIRSISDEKLQMQFFVDDDWLLAPKEACEESEFDYEYNCWIVGQPSWADHPVNALETFYDENDCYREDYESDCIAHWDTLVGELRQDHLARTLRRMLSDTPHIGHDQLGDCAIVSVQRHGPTLNDTGVFYKRLCVDAVDADLIGRICTNLQKAGVTVVAEEMANALSAAVRPWATSTPKDDYLKIRCVFRRS